MAKHYIKGSHTSYAITESDDTWIFTKNATVISDTNAVTATGIANTRIVVGGLISSSAVDSVGLGTSGTNVDIHVAKGGRILSSGNGIYAEASGSKITVEGRVEGGNNALSSFAANVEIEVAKSGKLLGEQGVVAYGDNLYLDNHGTIASRDIYIALFVSGDGAEVRNSGIVKGDPRYTMIYASGDDTLIVNEKSGRVDGRVRVEAEVDQSTTTVNHGSIRAQGQVFQGSAGDDMLKNDGGMTGYILLGSGNDVMDTRGGTVVGEIYGSTGDDILITDNAKYVLREQDGQGEDIIKSSVSYTLNSTYYIERLQLIGGKNATATGTGTGTERYEELWGNAGNNVLNGKGGYDYFDGKAGNDLLRSADDGVENRFYFGTGYDHDTIQYFDVGLDNVYLGGWKAIDDFADVLSHARNRGDDVVISAGKDSLTIRDVHKAELQADDFGFML